MTEEQFEKIINNAADHYNVPPVNPPLDEMWVAIEAESFARREFTLRSNATNGLVNNPWLRMAAVLVLGVAIGRMSMTDDRQPELPQVMEAAATTKPTEDSYQLTTERYLGQTVTLLVSLPGQLQSGRADTGFVRKAGESLATLRLLMDSPAANNPRMRALFEDLELVLVQVVQMPEDGSRSDARLIRQAMQDRDVMPRLFDAVAETPNF